MKKIYYIAIVLLLLILGIFLIPHHKLANLYFKFKRVPSVQISNIKIIPRNDFIIISNSDPIIIALDGNGITLDITKLDTPVSIERYKNNFNLLKIENRISNYSIGNKSFAAIETINNDLNKDKEIKILLEPKLILTIKVNNYQTHKHDLNSILEYLKTNVTWVN